MRCFIPCSSCEPARQQPLAFPGPSFAVIPHYLEINAEIVVNELVSHSRYLAPWDHRCMGSRIWRQSLCRFADDLKLPDDSVLQELCVAELLFGNATQVG